MMEKKISVVVPVYNAESTLKECLDSLFKNNYQNFEVIIVNDCSTDKSVDIAKRYPCKIINLSEQRGPAFVRDKSLSLAGGEIIAFLDSDCIVPEDWLTKINTELNRDILGIGGKYELPGDINSIGSLFMIYWDPKNIFYRKPVSIISLSGGNCAFWKLALMQDRKKKELIYCNRRVGGDDTIMCYELSKSGRLIYTPDISVIHNKRFSLLNILKETIRLGYGGAIVSSLCGSSLIKEPHRLYKSVLYLFSLLLFFSILLLSFTKQWAFCLYIFISYIVIQLPIILLTVSRYPRKRFCVFFFPAVIFVSDILYFIGHIKRFLDTTQRATKYFIWHVKLLSNIINPSALSRIFFFVTKRCNANCYFCFNKQDWQAKQDKDLSLDEIREISSKINFLSWLMITGGEPFLRNDIYEICKSFYSNCDTRIISIVTNGILTSCIEEATERLLIDCDGLYLTIIVALDHIGEMHDKIKGVEGSYKQALNTLKKLKVLQLRFSRLTLGINTAIIKENADCIEEILDYFRNNIDYDRQCLNLLRQQPCTSTDTELISVQKYLYLIKTKTFPRTPILRTNSLKERFRQASLQYFCDKSLKELKQKKALGKCLASQKFFTISNNGDVYACELLPEKLGNLRIEGYDFNQIAKNSKTKKLRLEIKNTKCYCNWPCAVASNGYLNIFWYPHIIKRTIHSSKITTSYLKLPTPSVP